MDPKRITNQQEKPKIVKYYSIQLVCSQIPQMRAICNVVMVFQILLQKTKPTSSKEGKKARWKISTFVFHTDTNMWFYEYINIIILSSSFEVYNSNNFFSSLQLFNITITLDHFHHPKKSLYHLQSLPVLSFSLRPPCNAGTH